MRNYLRAMRPEHWVKNALVFAAFFFAIGDSAQAAKLQPLSQSALRVAVAAALFCIISSGVYVLNDIRDAALDRMLDTVVPEMLAMIRRLAEPAEPTERERKLGKLILWDCKCGQTNVFPNGNGPVRCANCGVDVGMPPGVAPIDLDRAHPFCRIGDCKFNSGAGSRCSLEPGTPREPNHGACAGYAVLRQVELNSR